MRILTASLFGILSSLMLLNCSGPSSGSGVPANDKRLIDTNFDEFRGWVDNSGGSLSNVQAHSGRYSLTVGGSREYGLTFQYPLGELTASKPRKLHVRAWVRAEETTTPAQLVVEIAKPGTGERIFWRGINLFGGTKPGKWTKLETDLIMPDAIAFDQLLTVYMWANGAEKAIYLDDLQITSAD